MVWVFTAIHKIVNLMKCYSNNLTDRNDLLDQNIEQKMILYF